MKLNFREMRNKAGFTLESAADRMGISPSQVSRIESGTSDTTLRRTQEFAQLYECSPADLIAEPNELFQFDFDLVKDVLLGIENLELNLPKEKKVELTVSLLKMETERLKETPDEKVDLSRYQSLIKALV
ncbi:helix-turn-helix transcriptional regulator [Terasakiella sp. SH-1]|uniref:helix-turn-helix domain-containing protein n=1 Tax=Terasakiella sp. SH-1 TaxID=2560057 RepID=UPI001072FA61|nr:helix-turn-helix transcriptional regulator [Terasakiella sp. SH-1]